MTIKKTILVSTGALIIIGISSAVFLYFSPSDLSYSAEQKLIPEKITHEEVLNKNYISAGTPDSRQDNNKKCGDEICQPVEKNKGNCPQDCKPVQTSKTCSELNGNICSADESCPINLSEAVDTNSCCLIECKTQTKINEFGHPFSVWGLSNIFSKDKLDEDLKYMNELGIASFKAHTTVSWGLYQSKDPWSFADTTIAEANKYGIKPIFTITPLKGLGEDNQLPKNQDELDAYQEYVSEVVKKYKDDVDTWEVVNELSSHWKDSWGNYAQLLMITVTEIRKIQPDAKIVMPGPATNLFKSGNSDPDSVKVVLQSLKTGTKWFDYFDVHFIGDGDPSKNNIRYLDIIEWTNYYQPILKKYGYEDIGWFTEIKTSGGEGFIATEEDQAIDLVKKYTVGAAIGYDQIHNNGQIMQTTSKRWTQHEYRAYDGLIDKNSNKKLAYYSTKKIIDVLTDFDKTETIKQNEEGIFIYKFIKNGKPTWVAWSDDTSLQIELDVGNINSVLITKAIPKYETGKEVVDYNTAFNAETKNAQSNKITLTLTDVPVFVEWN